eukprot:1195489-Prorocentrum_minimum.AAC.6
MACVESFWPAALAYRKRCARAQRVRSSRDLQRARCVGASVSFVYSSSFVTRHSSETPVCASST